MVLQALAAAKCDERSGDGKAAFIRSPSRHALWVCCSRHVLSQLCSNEVFSSKSRRWLAGDRSRRPASGGGGAIPRSGARPYMMAPNTA